MISPYLVVIPLLSNRPLTRYVQIREMVTAYTQKPAPAVLGPANFYYKLSTESISWVTSGSCIFTSEYNRSNPPVAQNKTSAINNAIKTFFIEMIPQLFPFSLLN
jgi:hypothetical protein